MSRGFFILALQLAISLCITTVGVWAVTRPRHLQAFINENFALLPEVQPKSLFVSILIRAAGCGLIVYGYTLILNYRAEIAWLGK
jgi:hypothetical protein